jgi:hypothetical protein
MAGVRATWFGVLLALNVACGSDPVRSPPPDASGGTSGSGGTNGSGGTSGSAGATATCEDGPNYFDEELEKEDIGTVSARLLDGDEPVPGVHVTLCGVDVCSRPYESSSDGEVAITFGTPVTKAAFKYGNGLEHVELAIPVTGATDGVDLGDLPVWRLPEVGSPIAPGLRSESNGVAIELAANATTDVDELLPPYDSPETSAFRAVAIPAAELPAGVEQGQGLELVFGLSPIGASLCPAAVLELPNTLGWAPGTEVEFLLEGFGVLELQFWAPYAEWAVFATGEVDASGERLVTTEGGLPLISNVGVRRR